MAQPSTAQSAAPQIGDYRILSKIGQGGLAEIYKGLQTSLQREIAIKVLSAEYAHDSEIVARFERESLMIARLNHPNIVQVIDKGVQGGRYYFVMEYVDGADFKTIMQNPNVDLRVKIEMIIQVCKALDFAHKNGVIHRDIKPANILVDRQGTAKIADFGIAQLRAQKDLEVTSSDVIMGTIAYMSPEQKFSSANVTKATDIYALGIILYEICCGKKPEGRFKLPSEVNPKVPRAIDSIITTCLAESPSDRFPSATALKDALLKAFSGELQGSNEAVATIAGVESFMGKCRFLDTICEDRFGATYLVDNKETRKLFIIKVKTSGDAGLKEARILANLRHKNIMPVLGAGGGKEKAVIVTDYAQGGSLADRPGHNYSWKEAMGIIVQIAEGLNFAHRNNMVHGNLRPSNILFDQDDNVKLTDFGLPPHYSNQKDWYSSPEKRVSRQSDMFSVGVILFMLLTNKIPQHDRTGSPYLEPLDSAVPKEIKAIMRRLLDIRAARRYQSMEDLLIEYDEFLKDQNRPKVEVASPQPKRKNKTYLPVLLAVGAILAGVLLAVYWDILFK